MGNSQLDGLDKSTSRLAQAVDKLRQHNGNSSVVMVTAGTSVSWLLAVVAIASMIVIGVIWRYESDRSARVQEMQELQGMKLDAHERRLNKLEKEP